MDESLIDRLTIEQWTVLTELAEAENARLEEAASPVTHQAFNLGCVVGLLPGAIFLLVILLLTKFSIIGAAIALVLILTGQVAFANLAAMFARRNSIRRVYLAHSVEQIEKTLQSAGLNQDDFYLVARRILPSQAALCSVLPNPAPPPGQSKKFSFFVRKVK